MSTEQAIPSPSPVLTALEMRAAVEYSAWPLARLFLNQLRHG